MNRTCVRAIAWVCFLITILVVTFWKEHAVNAFNPQPEPPAKTFSLWDMAGLRVIATNPVTTPRSQTCEGTISFYDAFGMPLQQKVFSLPQGMSLAMDIQDPSPTDRLRSLIQVQVTTTPFGCAAFTVEVFDVNTLQTYTSHSGAI